MKELEQIITQALQVQQQRTIMGERAWNRIVLFDVVFNSIVFEL